MTSQSHVRGRGKHKPEDLTAEQITAILVGKIVGEQKKITEDNSHMLAQAETKKQQGKINVLSLFTGCGGLDLGCELAGATQNKDYDYAVQLLEDKTKYEKTLKEEGLFHVFYANDIFSEALASYERNHGESCFYNSTDIRKIKFFPTADIVLGGFPCPGFSAGGPRLIDDPRNFLYLHFIRCLQQSQPKIFVAENVKGMLTLGKGEVFRQIVQDFSAAGYTVYHELLNAKDYGVAQSRERVVLVGVRNDIEYGYNFEQPILTSEGQPLNTLDTTIRTFKDNPGPYYDGGYSPIFLSRNRKKGWNDVSFTIQASGRQMPMHPDGEPMEKVHKDLWAFQGKINRRISVREAAAIQSFPRWYDLGIKDIMSNNERDKIYKQIGNAVPVMLAYQIIKPLADNASHIF